MARYVTPLPALLARACEQVANRAAVLDPAAADHLAPLVGHWLKFELEGLGIDLWIGAEGDRLRVLAEPEHPDLQADTTVSGTPGALLATMARVIAALAASWAMSRTKLISIFNVSNGNRRTVESEA